MNAPPQKSKTRLILVLWGFCAIAFSACAGELVSATSGPPGNQAQLKFNVTDVPVTYFDAWNTIGGFQIRQYNIFENHIGFGDLLHSAVSHAYDGLPYSPPTRYFRKQTGFSSWSVTSATSTWNGSLGFVIGKTAWGEKVLESATWQDLRIEQVQKTNEYGTPLGVWYTITTTLHATVRPDSRQGVLDFDGYWLTHYEEPGREDIISTFSARRITLTSDIGPNYATRDSFFRFTPQGVWTAPPNPWTESEATWHIAEAPSPNDSIRFDYSISLSDEDTVADIQSRIEQDRALSPLENIPWNKYRYIQYGEITYEGTGSSDNISLSNYAGDLTTTGDFYEERAQLRFVVPQPLRIPGVGYRGRVIEYFYPRTDPTQAQIVKIHEVEMREGQWESQIINPVIRPEDGRTVLKNFSAVAELIQPHTALVLPPLGGTSSSTAPTEYLSTKPTFVWQSQTTDSSGAGQISRQVLAGSTTLQQINLSDAQGALGIWSQATAKWSVLPGATAEVRLWLWTDDGSALGTWKLLTTDDDLRTYYGSSTRFVFAEATKGGQATVRITIKLNAQEIHDDLLIAAAPPHASLAVDVNRDGAIDLPPDDPNAAYADTTSADKPFRFWLNDDIDNGGATPDYADNIVNGQVDLRKDFFPVFLDIKQLLSVLPPSGSVTYKLRQADGALNFVYTGFTRATAFRYQDSLWGSDLFSAPTIPITADGVALTPAFLNSIKDGDQGVIICEGRAASTQPLVLVVEKDGVVIAQTSLSLSIAPNILLFLHGMNSNTDTWDTFVDSPGGTFYGAYSGIISDRAIQSTPHINSNGIRCYRLQFGAYDMASTRTGVEGVTAANTLGYDTVGTRCGDFETFAELGQEVEDAITLLLARHPNARIVLAGHSRGGLAARAFLEKPGSSPAKAAVIGLLTTSSPNLGSRMGRIYGWLNTHQRGTPQAFGADWDAVDFLIQPTVTIGPVTRSKPPLDVRRPVILDVADNSLAIANLNSQGAVQNLPAAIRYGEIQYAAARFGQLSLTPVRYSVLESTGIGNLPQFKQLSPEATDFILAGGSPGDVQFIGDGLIPRANQRFTQLSGFSGIAITPRVVTDREVVHTEAPSQIADLIAQLKLVAPDLFP